MAAGAWTSSTGLRLHLLLIGLSSLSQAKHLWRLAEASILQHKRLLASACNSFCVKRADCWTCCRGQSQARARFSAFLADIYAFDAVYFRVPAPEAALMDPQQRLLLEVWPSHTDV